METKVCKKCHLVKSNYRIYRKPDKIYYAKVCRDCDNKYLRAWFKSPKGKEAKKRERNSPKNRATRQVWTENNRDKIKQYANRWKAKTSPEQLQKYRDDRVKRQLQSCLTPKNLSKVKSIFWQNNKKGLATDHIIPLSHKDICGLNVPWNLQTMTNQQNRSKNNWFDPVAYTEWLKDTNKLLLKPKS